MTAQATPGGVPLGNARTPSPESGTAFIVAHPARRDRVSLGDARSHLATAEDALGGWYARQTSKTRCYVNDGHVTIRFIDELLRELHRVRAALVDEIRADEDERAARIDRMLAEARARGDSQAGEAHDTDAGDIRPAGAP